LCSVALENSASVPLQNNGKYVVRNLPMLPIESGRVTKK
jgi:hypothetical protein